MIAGCRKIIGLDGCFLKGCCGGQLLSAVGRDGNNQMFPISWAVVEGENRDSWQWFLNLLKDDLQLQDGEGWTFISDQQKGLEGALADLFPFSETRNCARHIYANLRKRFKGIALKKTFWKAAKSTTIVDFEYEMENIKQLDGGAYEFLMARSPRKWCKAFFKTDTKCDIVHNNLCECFNGYIIHSRGKPLIEMLEDIRKMLMTRLQQKRDIAMKKNWDICPRAKKELQEKIEMSCQFNVLYNGELQFEVTSTTDRNGYTVDLHNHNCACKLWDLSGIPCEHACAAILFMRYKPAHYVSDWFSVQTYMRAYSEMLRVVRGERFWPRVSLTPPLPPPLKRPRGRPQKLRRREIGEEADKSTVQSVRKHGVEKVSRKGTIITCTLCKTAGHNRLTCKVSAQTSETVEGGENVSYTMQTENRTEGTSSIYSGLIDVINRLGGHNEVEVDRLLQTAAGEIEKGRTKLPVKRKVMPKNSNTGKRASGREWIPPGFGSFISPRTGNTYISTAPGRCYLAGAVSKSNDRGKGKAVTTTTEPKKRTTGPKEKLMSTAIRVGESYSDITETEYQLMNEALYNSRRETRRAGVSVGEGQSTGVPIDFSKGGGTQESANK